MALRQGLHALLTSETYDYSTFQAEFERFHELLETQASLRSQFWNMGVLIPPELKATYNRMQPLEIPAGIFMALRLDKFGSDDDATTTHVDTADSKPHIPVGRLAIAVDAPDRSAHMCRHLFGLDLTSFRFLLTCKATIAFEAEAAERSERCTFETRVLDVRQQIHDDIVEFERMRATLADLSKKAVPAMRAILETDVTTHVESDHGSDDENDNESDPDAFSDGGEVLLPPLPKRRKCYDDLGRGKDTDLQRISLHGIEVQPARGVNERRAKQFRGEPEPHLIELMGAIDSDQCFQDRLPVPLAPAFSHGAELDDEGKLIRPNSALDPDTVVTYKMMHMNPTLLQEYDDMQALARSMTERLRNVMRLIRETFDFVVRIERGETDYEDRSIASLKRTQKFAIGQLYLQAISVRKAQGTHGDEADGSGLEDAHARCDVQEDNGHSGDDEGEEASSGEEWVGEEDDSEAESDDDSEAESGDDSEAESDDDSEAESDDDSEAESDDDSEAESDE